MQTILPGLHQIALPTPFAVGDVNTYLAEGDPLTLIDCGIGYEAGYQALAAGLAEIGYRISDIRRLLITHHHTDHLGLAGRVVAESGAEVIAHPYSAPYLETPHEVRAHERRYTDVAFREGGVPQPLIEVMGRVEEYLGTLVGAAQVARTLDEGDTIRFAGLPWRVLHTPGHAGGMLCFYQPDSRVLLSSDHVLRDISSNPLIEAPEKPGEKRPRRLLDYMRELERVAALDTAIAYTGHGELVTDVPALVEKRLLHHQKRADKLFDLFSGQPRNLYELTQAMFPQVAETESYLTLSEVLGHLDLLERDGRIAREMHTDGVLYWQPVGQPVHDGQ